MLLTHSAQLLLNVLLTVAYPQPCTLCGRSVEERRFGIACDECWTSTKVFSEHDNVCWKCGLAIPVLSPSVAREQLRCHRCDEQPFTAARACGVYEGALRESVLRLKREPHIPTRLIDLLVEIASQPPLDLSTRVIPVPLHPQRQRARGFNQSSIIASAVAQSLGLPLDEVSFFRARPTDKNRAGLDLKGRRDSVASAFAVRFPTLVEGEDVLLVDDVFTTGATAGSCANVLLKAGARSVFVLTIARPAY